MINPTATYRSRETCRAMQFDGTREGYEKMKAAFPELAYSDINGKPDSPHFWAVAKSGTGILRGKVIIHGGFVMTVSANGHCVEVFDSPADFAARFEEIEGEAGK